MLFRGSMCNSVMSVSKSGHPRVPDSVLPMQVRSERSGRSHIPQSRVHNLQLRAGTAKERKINIKKQQQQQQKTMEVLGQLYQILVLIGEGNGNPLQYSCLENPRDRGAWWAAVYGVAQSQTRLKQLSSRSSSISTQFSKVAVSLSTPTSNT